MIPGMAYLVRRLLENTSNESWLKAGFMDGVDESTLLASPHMTFENDPGRERIEGAPERHALSPAVEGVGDGRPFFTESLRDFAEADQRDAFSKAIERSQVPAVANDATEADARAAIDTLSDYFPTWRPAKSTVPADLTAAPAQRCAPRVTVSVNVPRCELEYARTAM